MKKHIYTTADLNAAHEIYKEFVLKNDYLYITRVSPAPSYKSGVRRDRAPYARFVLSGVRLVCLTDIMKHAVENHHDPLEIMMRLHNYGVFGKKHITLNNLEHLLVVADAIMSNKTDRRTMTYKVLSALE